MPKTFKTKKRVSKKVVLLVMEDENGDRKELLVDEKPNVQLGVRALRLASKGRADQATTELLEGALGVEQLDWLLNADIDDDDFEKILEIVTEYVINGTKPSDDEDGTDPKDA